MALETYRFSLGSMRCVVVNDGTINPIPTPNFFSGASPEELQAALLTHDVREGNLKIPCNILYVEIGDERVLVDTGGRPDLDPVTGNLVAGLEAEGIKPEDITLVLHSHGHWDHVVGSATSDGEVVFPNACFVMAKSEYKYWTTQLDASEPIGQALEAIRGQVELIEPDVEVAPGVKAIHAPGHTLHHTAFSFGDQELLCVVDCIDHPIHVENPTWTPSWDMDKDKSIISRRQLFTHAATNDVMVHAFHGAFPGLGYIREAGDGWKWEEQLL